MVPDEELDRSVEAFVQATEEGDTGALERLILAHPRLEHQLTAFAVLEAAVPTVGSPEDLISARAMLTADLKERALAAALGRTPAQAIAGILAQARAVGLDARALAAAADLPRDVVLQLDKRLVDVRSVPRRCLQRLAETLQTSAAAVSAFLAGAPAARAAAYNYAPAAPRVSGQGSFAQALADSPLCTPEQRAYWETALREEGLL